MRARLIAATVPALALLSFTTAATARADGLAAKEVLAQANRLAQKNRHAAGEAHAGRAPPRGGDADARFMSKYQGAAIRGVLAYQMGEGGFVVKVKKGHGLVHLDGQAGDAKLELRA